MTVDIRPLLITALPLAAAMLAFVPQPADACGGTFCDGVSGPNIMPVDQTGESILFWIDRSGDEPFTEAHIQIQYEGDAENFAWIIPVSTAPQVLVGNQALFDSLLAATVPTFSITSVFDNSCAGGGSFSFCMGDDTAGDSGLNGVTLSDGGLSDDAGDTGGPRSSIADSPAHSST